jgi:hypothetical protein
MKLHNCKFCGQEMPIPYRSKTIKRLISESAYAKRMYCSMKCRVNGTRDSFVGANNPNYKGGKSTCVDCGSILAVRYSAKESPRCRTCWAKHNTGENNPRWKGGFFCVDCGAKTSCGYRRCRNCYGKSVTGEKSVKYKTKLKYKYLHTWVKKQLGNPKQCSHCSIEGKLHKGNWSIHWANKSGEYLRDLSDWIGLCPKCHVRYDKKN